MIECRERADTPEFKYVPYSFALEDVEEILDRSSAETIHSLLIMRDGSHHLVDLFYLDLIHQKKYHAAR